MLIYPKNKKGDQKDSLVWKEDNFLRLRGLADSVVHKTDFKTEDGKDVLAGAYYERIRRELETLEAAKLAQLSKSLGPKAAALKAMRSVPSCWWAMVMKRTFSGTYTQISPVCCSVAVTPSIPTSKLKPVSDVTTLIKAQVLPFWSSFMVPAVLAVMSFSSSWKLATLICALEDSAQSISAMKASKRNRFKFIFYDI